MNNPLECAEQLAGAAADNSQATPAQTEAFDLLQILAKGFPKHGRAEFDAPDGYRKEPQYLDCASGPTIPKMSDLPEGKPPTAAPKSMPLPGTPTKR